MIRHVVLLWFIGVVSVANALPHMDPQMTGAEYTPLLARYVDLRALPPRDRAVADIIKTGKRSLDWLKYINSKRPSDKQISLSSAATQIAYPIASPSIYNATIVQSLYDAFAKEAPNWFSDIVLKGGAFADNPPVSDDEYIQWGLRLDRIYQSAARWLLMSPNLSQYAALRENDVRGYYNLSQYADIQATLDGYDQLAATEQGNLVEWIAGMCMNGGTSLSSCRSTVKSAVSQKKALYPYYQKYVPAAKRMWDGYFQLAATRPDVKWDKGLNEVMTVPFTRPSEAKLQSFLSDNIEDEWKFNFWKLVLGFQSSALAHLEFEAGTTPHVNGLGGNTITMDDNQPLTEYNVQWTIRHEFGHVIGFPDCYVEFYDSDLKAMVNYQLDTTNLMCSRRGHILQIHYDELKKAYGK